MTDLESIPIIDSAEPSQRETVLDEVSDSAQQSPIDLDRAESKQDKIIARRTQQTVH